MTWPGSSFYLSSIKPEGDFSYQFIVQKKGGCSPREALTELDKKIEEEESSFDCTLSTVVEELHNIHGLMKQMTEMAKGNDYYIFIIFSLMGSSRDSLDEPVLGKYWTNHTILLIFF